MPVTSIRTETHEHMFPCELTRGLPLTYRPPEHIIGQLMKVLPFDFQGRPAVEPLRLWAHGVAYSYIGGLWNAQALTEGTEAIN